MRPVTSAETLASWLGVAARLPLTISSCARSARSTLVSVTSGVGFSSSPAFSSAFGLLQPQSAQSRIPAKILFFIFAFSVQRNTDGLLQRCESAVRGEQAVEVSPPHFIELALRIQHREQVAFARLVTLFRHLREFLC